MVKRAAVGLLLMLLLPFAAAQQQPARAYLDRAVVYNGETVLYTIEIDAEVGGVSPDVGRLTADFDILDSGRSTQLSIINGKPSSVTQWTFELEPKRVGELRLPALAIGQNYRTPALQLTVLAGDDPNAPDPLSEALFFEVEAQPADPYVQAQVRYTERLYYDVALREGALNRNNWPTELTRQQLGEDLHYVGQRNGRNYRVLERRYALFPQRSGDITIPPVTFSGRVTQPGQLARGRKVKVRSRPLVLKVRPRPDSSDTGPWLPSAELKLSESWSQDDLGAGLRVGEPVTRTLTLTVRGLSAAQLPALSVPDFRGQATAYPDQPKRSERQETTDGWLTGRLEQRVAIIPGQAGELQLPALRLHWWDTETDQARVAELPARRLTVLAAADTPAPSAAPTAPQTQPSESLSPTATAPFAWQLTTAGLTLLWLLTLFGWWRDRRRPPAHRGAEKPAAVDAKTARQRLRQACKEDNPNAAAAALLDWAAARWPAQPPGNLGALAARLDGAGERLDALQAALYGATPTGWRGDALWRDLSPLLRPDGRESRRAPTAALPPLYPQG